MEPTQETSAPSRMPSTNPTTSYPTTLAPTLPPVDECSNFGVRYSVAVTMRLLNWVQNLDTETSLREIVREAFVSGVLRRWAPWTGEWCFRQSMQYTVIDLRRRLQDAQDVDVEAVFSMNVRLFADVFNQSAYNATEFEGDMASAVSAGLVQQEEEEGGENGGELGALSVGDEFTQSIETTIATTDEAKDETGFGLGDDCDAFGLKCWMLYAILVLVLLFMIIGAVWFCKKTRADVAKGKFASVDNAGETTSNDVEMQPTATPDNEKALTTEEAGAQNLDL